MKAFGEFEDDTLGTAETDWNPPKSAPNIFVTGYLRSGTSMVSLILREHGVFFGFTPPPTKGHPVAGIMENALLNVFLRGMLVGLSGDHQGQSRLPTNLPPMPALNGAVRNILIRDNWDRKSAWGFKDVKLAWVWSRWHEAFPDAVWIVVRRDRDDCFASIKNAGFDFILKTRDEWEFWFDEMDRRIEQMPMKLIHVDCDDVMAGDFEPIAAALDRVGLAFDEKTATACLEPGAWKSWEDTSARSSG